MLQKWKLILVNWINCYYDEDGNKKIPVTQESLLKIISHLRENLNLNESKSSILDAHSIQEFLLEKFPDFRFENGTVEPQNEEEIYLAASLLLFFVCVNSKDVDIKKAMCYKLITDDQVVIFKFTKYLLDCRNISCRDVLTAIAEACEPDAIMPAAVSETPPALRSLHSEVRRLQAALDAECFDRNYLQEELTRTNLKMEKLVKDKDQYKQDIASLKSKISCCGQESESENAESSNNNLTKLLKQIEETELRLCNVQEQLDEVTYERNTYKSKVDELKRDRDKWFTQSQQESLRTNQLTEELETERKHVTSLKELVLELRQHHQLNGLDCSQLECDDLDASVHSLRHNMSVCSEVCANVVEVQLGEERAKIGVLKEQIQLLQDQLTEMNQKSEEESKNFAQIIADKDNDIFNLKHRINEEIEEKNNLKAHCDNEMTKLNNEVNELEQRLRDTNENSRSIIDSKLQEIQILQEEKLSLLKSLNDETTKLGNIIQDLKAGLDSERSSKIKMRDDMDNQIMKLKEKVLNRNNELVEFQNKICEKGEMIERVQAELKREKESHGDLVNKYNDDILNFNTKIQTVENDLQQRIDEYRNLEEFCQKLQIEIRNRDVELTKLQGDIKLAEKVHTKEKRDLQYNLDEKNATVETLKIQLNNEIQYKLSIEDELKSTKASLTKVNEELDVLNSTNSVLSQQLQNEIDKNAKLKEECMDLNKIITEQNNHIMEKDLTIETTKKSVSEDKTRFEETCVKMQEAINSKYCQLMSETAEKNNLKQKLNTLSAEKEQLLQEISDKHNTASLLQTEVETLSKLTQQHEISIKKLEDEILENKKLSDLDKKNFDTESTKLMTKLNEKDKCLKELRLKTNNTIAAHELEIDTLKMNLAQTETRLQNKYDEAIRTETEKTVLIEQLGQMNSFKNKFEKEYMNKCALLSSVSTQLNEEIMRKNEEINIFKQEMQSLLKLNEEKREEINDLKSNIEKVIHERDNKITDLSKKIERIELLVQSENELKKSIEDQAQVVESLQAENVQLQYTIEEDNSTHEVIIREKDSLIEKLEAQLKSVTENIELLQRDYENDKLKFEKFKKDAQEQISEREKQVSSLNNKIIKYESHLKEIKTELDKCDTQINILKRDNHLLSIDINSLRKSYTESAQSNDALKESLNTEKAAIDYLENEKLSLKRDNDSLIKTIADNENAYKILASEKDSLLNEKAILVQQLMEERSIRKIADEGKEALLIEAREMNSNMKLFEEMKHMLLQEKECLTQQLVEERHGKELAEQEKNNIHEVKLELEAKIASIIILKSNQIQSLSEIIDEQKQRNNKLQDNIEQLKQEIEELMNDKKNLNEQIAQHRNIEDQLKTQNSKLFHETDSLLNSLKEIKNTLNETESEKKSLEDKILHTNNKYALDIEEKQEELNSVSMEYKQLKTEHKSLEEESEKLSSLLNSGLTKILDCLKKENICNEIIKKYEIDNKKISGTEICDVLFDIVTNLTADVVLSKNLEKVLEQENTAVKEITEMVKQKDIVVNKLQDEIKVLQKVIDESKHELIKQQEKYETSLDTKSTECHNLLLDNQTLRNELNDVKIQLEVKVHSLKDKLVDNENLTDKLKKTYECQIDNLNMMISKVSTYLKEKTAELDALRNEKERLQHIVEENNTAIKSLEDELKNQKQSQEKLISDFESERLVFKNMVTVTESVMEDQKVSLNKVISEHIKNNENLENEVKTLKESIENQRSVCENKITEKEMALQAVFKELCDLRKDKENLEIKIISQNEHEDKVVNLEECVAKKTHEIEILRKEIKDFDITLNKYKDDILMLEEKNNEWKIKNEAIETEFGDKLKKLKNDYDVQTKCAEDLKVLLDNKSKENNNIHEVVEDLTNKIEILKTDIVQMQNGKDDLVKQLNKQKNVLENEVKHNETMQSEYSKLLKVKDEKDTEVSDLQKQLQGELYKNEENGKEIINLTNKCSILQEYQTKAETELERRQKDINTLQNEVKTLETQVENVLSERDRNISNLKEERDAKRNLEKEVTEDRDILEHLKCQLNLKDAEIKDLKKRLDERKEEGDIIRILRSENEKLITAFGQRETFAVVSKEESPQNSGHSGDRDLKQVDNTSDTQSSLESIKTISDLEKIVQDKNRTIKILQSDITFLKSLFAESENKLLDVSKDLELSKENCHQLSGQLKKIVHQKNEEIADLKKQITKMSFTENRASQIIKVSAKYQAIILKRIAEIKSNTVLKELTNFGNSNGDSDLRRSLTSGSITMEDLENFLETTERHLRRCSERQLSLQKERDRLSEVNKINESEIINMQKFLTEMAVSVKTFNSYKEMYSQKLTRVVSIQRTVRREILNLESNITDVAMCKLERGYAAVMQDLSECAMNFERWMERCISRTISSEKIKQAFSSEVDRLSLASGSFQNTGLEVQLEELEKKFQNLLDEVVRAQKGEGAKDVQSLTVMEVRAEYEDKLNRMKAKMKQLYQEQISIFKDKQRQEILNLEQELQKAQNDLRESSRAYKEHVKELTTELWNVGEKFVMKHDEAEWLRKKQKHGSLMSLQHVHSSGLVPVQEPSRQSDTHSLRSLPVNNNEKTKEGRTLHMSDEEGEVFDNRWLRELSSTPRSHPHPDVHPHPHPPHPPHRLSELRWRNSLCPPHLKSSYPAETQFVSALHEEEIKCPSGPSMSLGGRQRKEVGITAYKKPGPPTPSKQAGRLSATDSELRECVREPSARRGGGGGGGGGGTPGRIRALFRSGRSDTAEGTPKTRRLSNIFRKK